LYSSTDLPCIVDTNEKRYKIVRGLCCRRADCNSSLVHLFLQWSRVRWKITLRRTIEQPGKENYRAMQLLRQSCKNL
jgi:hypothetical protein